MNDRIATIDEPKRKPFRSRRDMVRLAPEAWDRQSRITLLAWDLLVADHAAACLNSHDMPLNGRPLDISVASTAGDDAVERELSSWPSSD